MTVIRFETERLSFVDIPHKLIEGFVDSALLGRVLVCTLVKLKLFTLPSVPWLALSPPFNYACEKYCS